MERGRFRKFKCLLIIIILSLILFKFLNKEISSKKFTDLPKLRKIKPLQSTTIAIDPGHGGIDSGTKYGDLLEKDINLEIGLKLRRLLVEKGANTVMTREIDDSLERYISDGSRHSRDLKARVKIIQDSNAEIFISLHVNHIRNSKPLGAIVFFNPEVKDSKYLSEIIQENLNKLSEYESAGININRTPIFGDYYILNNLKIPGVLIETGFISNQLDRRLLCDVNHQNELVELITESVLDYIKTTKYDK